MATLHFTHTLDHLKLPEKTLILRLRPPPEARQAALAVAPRFGLARTPEAGNLRQEGRTIIYNEGELTLTTYQASGALRFHDLGRWQVDDGVSNVDFDEAEAEQVARRLIEKLDMAPRDEIRLMRSSKLSVGLMELTTRNSETRAIDMAAIFQRTINDVPVLGPGGKVIVYLDHSREMTGVDRIWRDTDSVEREVARLQSMDFIREQMDRHTRDLHTAHVEVGKIEFGYYELGYDDEQTVLQPAYVVPYSIRSPSGKGFRSFSEHVLPAAVDAPGAILPRREVQPPQDPRSTR